MNQSFTAVSTVGGDALATLADMAERLLPMIDDRWRTRLVAVSLFVMTLLAFSPIFSAEFTWWDDDHTIHHNPELNPPNLAGLMSIWKEPRAGLYVPVTYTWWWCLAKIAWLDQADPDGIQLNPLIFHGGSVVLHAITTLLVFTLLKRLRLPLLAAAIGAALFGLHPLQVEAVGWASGAKDLLAGLFAVAALVVYCVDSPSVGRRCVAGGLLVLSVLSKPQTMATPLAAFGLATLVLDQPWRRALRDAAIGMLLVLPVVLIARSAQYVTISPYDHFGQRLLTMGYTYTHQLMKLLVPMNLTIDYAATPRRIAASSLGRWAWLVPLVLGGVLIAAGRRARFPQSAVAASLLLLAPVSGIAAFQFQYYSSVADHYVYAAMIGPALLLGWCVARFPAARWISAVVLAAFLTLTVRQAFVWHDQYSLFSRAVEVQPDSYIAHSGLASYYAKPDHYDYDLAAKHYRRAAELIPIFPSAPWFLGELVLHQGVATGRQDLVDEGVALRRRAIALYRSQPYRATDRIKEVFTEFVGDCIRLGRFDEAADMLEQAHEVFPDDQTFTDLLRATRERAKEPRK